MSHVLQHLVMPNLAFGAPETMYVRLQNDRVHALMSEGRLLFESGGRTSFDTYFNSVSVGAWKIHTAVSDMQLHLRGSGRFIVRFGLHRMGHAQRWLAEHLVTLQPEQDFVLPIGSWTKLDSGMLYFALEALEPGSLTAGHFATSTVPQRAVKLGIVITHFNRMQWVLPAIARIRDELLNDPLYSERIELVVVDNSQNIGSDEAAGITLLPNENLGGSGGFTRGLLHLKDQKNFTHCLFMDDDASCEIESIRRAVALTAYSRNSSTSVAGGLLREVEPSRLIDKGSNFNGAPYCDRGGLDMRKVDDLLRAEHFKEAPQFGGWWFLMFSIEHVEHYSYPFFVKCDDVLFGMTNPFPIITLNGISCWSDDFALKEGPLPRYLDTRSRIVMNLVTGNHGLFDSVKWASKFILAPLLSYNYASCRAAILGLNHVLLGPDFFEKNLDTSQIRKTISNFSPNEKMSPINKQGLKIEFRGATESTGRKAFRLISLNGFLLPSFLIKNKLIHQKKGFRGNLREIFRYSSVLYEHEESGLGYIAKHDKGQFLSLLASYFIGIAKFAIRYRALKEQYSSSLNYLTSESYWRKIYSQQTK